MSTLLKWTGVSRRLIRTSILLTLACCYLMWTVTYLAQVHPLERTFSVLGASGKARLGTDCLRVGPRRALVEE